MKGKQEILKVTNTFPLISLVHICSSKSKDDSPQKRGCSLSNVDADDDKMSIKSSSSANLKQVIVKLRKLPPVHKASPAQPAEKYDFNSIAVVRIKRLWNDLPCPQPGTNLLTNGIVKNTKRMRFQTKVLTLDDED